MEPVLLGWGKRPNAKDKYKPLLFLNPDTKEPIRHRTVLSRADCEGEEISLVMDGNNFLVETARKWCVKLGENYEQFLIVGLRLAQQLDGRLREIMREQFAALYNGLETALVNGVLVARKQRRDAGLESLLEATDGMPADDVAKLSGYVAALKQRTIPGHAEKRGYPHNDSTGARLERIQNDQTLDDKLVQNAKFIPPELRTDYVQTVEVAELHGKLPYSLHEETEKIRRLISDLGVENGKLYLKVLHDGVVHVGEEYERAIAVIQAAEQQIEKARNIAERLEAHKNFEAVQRKTRVPDHPYEFYDSLNRYFGRLDLEDRNVYFNLLSATQGSGLWLEPYDAFNITENVKSNGDSQAVKRVLEFAVEALKEGHGAFFDVLEAHGVPATRTSYAAASQ